MRRRMRCLWHQEETASLVQRKNGWYCFGVCQKLYTPEEVKEKTGEHYEYEEIEHEKEDLKEAFGYINSLKLTEQRGLKLPTDEGGYFITWPNDAYYKYRLYNPGKGSKYIGPTGHKPPLFWATRTGKSTLALTEGEINALSVAEVMPEWDVCSPGSASMFNSNNLSKNLTQFKEYSNVVVILDEDAAGMKGLIEARAAFLYKLPFVRYLLISPDCNDVLVNEGKKALRERLLRANSG